MKNVSNALMLVQMLLEFLLGQLADKGSMLNRFLAELFRKPDEEEQKADSQAEPLSENEPSESGSETLK